MRILSSLWNTIFIDYIIFIIWTVLNYFIFYFFINWSNNILKYSSNSIIIKFIYRFIIIFLFYTIITFFLSMVLALILNSDLNLNPLYCSGPELGSEEASRSMSNIELFKESNGSSANINITENAGKIIAQSIVNVGENLGLSGSIAGIAGAAASALKGSSLPPMYKTGAIILAGAAGGATFVGSCLSLLKQPYGIGIGWVLLPSPLLLEAHSLLFSGIGG